MILHLERRVIQERQHDLGGKIEQGDWGEGYDDGRNILVQREEEGLNCDEEGV